MPRKRARPTGPRALLHTTDGVKDSFKKIMARPNWHSNVLAFQAVELFMCTTKSELLRRVQSYNNWTFVQAGRRKTITCGSADGQENHMFTQWREVQGWAAKYAKAQLKPGCELHHFCARATCPHDAKAGESCDEECCPGVGFDQYLHPTFVWLLNGHELWLPLKEDDM